MADAVGFAMNGYSIIVGKHGNSATEIEITRIVLNGNQQPVAYQVFPNTTQLTVLQNFVGSAIFSTAANMKLSDAIGKLQYDKHIDFAII